MTPDQALIAGSPHLSAIVATLLAPVVIILLASAFVLVKSPKQRLANLLLGGIGTVAGIFTWGIWLDPWGELPLLLLVLAMIGGEVIGISISVGSRWLFSVQQCPPAKPAAPDATERDAGNGDVVT
jgi:hypothetical protein